jgi:hypothetical protein
LRLKRRADGRVLRSWVVQSRIGGRQHKWRLGSADVLSASDARSMALVYLGRVARLRLDWRLGQFGGGAGAGS